MRFLPVNGSAILVELADLDQTLALLHSLQTTPIAGVQELVPAARTILVQFAPHRISEAGLVQAIAQRDLDRRTESSDVLIEIPVIDDGEDLAEVARILGIGVEEVVRRHTACEWSAAFTGFAPGFAYLSGGDPIFDLPRRTTPRTRVPAGAVALAGTFSGVYPQESPGGWQLIGVTEEPMWDLSRPQPALIQPGYRVRFVDVTGRPKPAAASARAAAGTGADQDADRNPGNSGNSGNPGSPGNPDKSDEGPGLRVRATGLLTLFQDRGRHGQARQGVSASGAMDQAAFKTANRLVGNASDQAVLETVGGGLALQSVGENVIAVTGADAPLTLTTQAGRRWRVPRYQPVALADGDQLSVGEPAAGARCYVAVRGGFDVAPVLGSASTDVLAHVGPAPLAVGQRLGVGPVRGGVVTSPGLPPGNLPRSSDEVVLDVVLGPRTDWFTAQAVESLSRQRWQVTPQSNRVGLRLAGDTPLVRAIADELPSEGTPLGAIQVPASGQPVLFLADHPLTGGYPVIGCVAPHHLDRAGQIPVGAWLRFNPIRRFGEIATAEAAPLSEKNKP